MAEIPDRLQFEPSKSTREKWLKTRKESYYIGNQSLPGLYQTTSISNDAVWFWIAMVIEVIAMSLTVFGGLSRGLTYLLGAVGIVILMVAFDFLGVKLSLDNKAKKCLIRNRIVMAEPQPKLGLLDQLNAFSWRTFWAFMFLLTSAILKVLALWLLTPVNGIHYLVIFTLLYFAVVYIHLTHTDYFIAEMALKRSIRKESKTWRKQKFISSGSGMDGIPSKFDAVTRHETFSTDFIIPYFKDNSVFKLNGIMMIEKERWINSAEYQISATGVVLDEDISMLCQHFLPQHAALIGEHCLRLQINSLAS